MDAFDWFPATQGLRRTEKGRHSVGGGGSLHKETVWNALTTTSTWLEPATKLRVRAGALTLHLENVGAAGSAADGGSYSRVREHHGMADGRGLRRSGARGLASARGLARSAHGLASAGRPASRARLRTRGL